MGEPPVASGEPIDYISGDIFFGLDFQAPIVLRQKEFLLKLKHNGVDVSFLVYDILSVTNPEFFWPEHSEVIRRWLELLPIFGGIIAISRTTMEAVKAWYAENSIQLSPSLRFNWVHIGADIENSAPTYGLPKSHSRVLSQLRDRPSFLVVGTIEPRKGHTQTLAAFEKLWAGGTDANLVIVGKQGWRMEALVERLRNHPELGKRLFWLEGISDEYLEEIYVASICLIAPSEGEGFGLPLVEAARRKLPILARGIPVFREVAGDHATYFDGLEPGNLADAVRNWLSLCRQGRHAKSDDMPRLTWAQSAERMKEILLKDHQRPRGTLT